MATTQQQPPTQAQQPRSVWWDTNLRFGSFSAEGPIAVVAVGLLGAGVLLVAHKTPAIVRAFCKMARKGSVELQLRVETEAAITHEDLVQLFRGMCDAALLECGSRFGNYMEELKAVSRNLRITATLLSEARDYDLDDDFASLLPKLLDSSTKVQDVAIDKRLNDCSVFLLNSLLYVVSYVDVEHPVKTRQEWKRLFLGSPRFPVHPIFQELFVWGSDTQRLAKLLRAVEQDDVKFVRKYVSADGDVNVADERGWTPLHYAAENGRDSIAQELIAAGADVNATIAKSKRTPLHVAAKKGLVSIVEVLIAAKADVNAKDRDEFTPYQTAMYFAGARYLSADQRARCAAVADILRRHGGQEK